MRLQITKGTTEAVRYLFAFLIPVTLAASLGCDGGGEEPVVKPLPPELKPFDAAFNSLATSNDAAMVNKSIEKLKSGETEALRLLALKLDDGRIPSTTAMSAERKVRGRADMGMHAYWIICEMVEVAPEGEPENETRFYSTAYGPFSMSTVAEWLAAREDKTLVEIQLDAAKASLAIAEKESLEEPNKYSKPAVQRYLAIINKLSKSSNSKNE